MGITDKQRSNRKFNTKSLANLKPFKKGQSGNPQGRPPKDFSITSIIKAELDDKSPRDKEGRTWREVLADALRLGAIRNPVLMKEILDRLEGKVPQPIGGEGGGPVKHEMVIKVASQAEKEKLEKLGGNDIS